MTTLLINNGEEAKTVKMLDGISDDEITSLEIPTGQPIVYNLDDGLNEIERYYLSER